MRHPGIFVVVAGALAACSAAVDTPTDQSAGSSGDRQGAAGESARPAGSVTGLPIDHIVVVVKENHTFDNYFGSFPGAEGTSVAHTSSGDVPVTRPPLFLLRDLCHSHSCALADWAGGQMNGWNEGDAKNASDHLAYAQYTEADIPNYWQYARHFVLADHFFSSMLGPSFPGHSFFLAAQAGWALGNPSQIVPWGCDDWSGTTVAVEDQATCSVQSVFPCFDYATLPDILPPDVTWKFYGSREPPLIGQVWSMFDAVHHIRYGPGWSQVVDWGQFDKDVKNGTLPNVAWLVDQDLDSEHPPLSICAGENWVVARMNVLMKSPYWSRTAVLMSWDDFGGWYDHVAPPEQTGCDPDRPYGLGMRLPLIIVSPYAKPGYVMKGVAHQASIPKFIEKVFDLGSLQEVDPAAQDGDDTNDLMDAFDFNQPPQPPLVLRTRSCFLQR